MKIKVFVRLKPGVLDVQGKAVEQGLHGLGFKEIAEVRVGKLIEFEIESSSFEQAKSRVEEMCTTLLANTVIENFEIVQG
jgi:phosphoribosylformylglycinamidine synthase PurS subunit